jgi:hypothetical protein
VRLFSQGFINPLKPVAEIIPGRRLQITGVGRLARINAGAGCLEVPQAEP